MIPATAYVKIQNNSYCKIQRPSHCEKVNHFNNNGMNEGIARAFSQACVYSLESKKTLLQIHGQIPSFSKKIVFHRWLTGITTSSITSGFVFSLYFTIYNNLSMYPFAGAVSSFITSFIKLPIGNSMRIMQSGASSNIIDSAKKLYLKNGFHGLYNGYGLCVIEDMIEIDLRIRLYKFMKYLDQQYICSNNNLLSIGYGGLSGAITTGITIPFDTIRAHMCFNTLSSHNTITHPLSISKNLLMTKGIAGFYNGVSFRITSNAVKNALFFLILDILSKKTIQT